MQPTLAPPDADTEASHMPRNVTYEEDLKWGPPGPLRLRHVLQGADTELLEMLAGAISGGWAFLLFLPGANAFRNPHWWYVSHHLTQPGFGVICAAHSLLKFVGVATGNQRVRRTSAMVGSFMWSSLAVSFVWVDPHGLGTVNLVVLSFASLLCYYRRVQEARVSRRAQRRQQEEAPARLWHSSA